MDNTRVIFTKEMKKTHTLLIPTMLPMHFRFIARILELYGYKSELLVPDRARIVQAGLKYVHNDTCYPATLVIGQFLDAIDSGRYDPHKVALLMVQTGGGCRASNYVSLLRKALKKAGYPYIPVVSFNVSGLEKNPGFELNIPMLHRMLYGILYSDLMMSLANQIRPREKNPGDADRLYAAWVDRLVGEMKDKKINYPKVKENYRAIVRDFAAIPVDREKDPIRVGVVGEIYVKFSPLGNNNLEAFLQKEGAEVVMPGLTDFCLYCVYNGILDYELYRKGKKTFFLWKAAYRFLISKQQDMIDALNEVSAETAVPFHTPTLFDHTRTLNRGVISSGVKMGEGWLLTAEMLELIESGVTNIVCTQPFGCLPNHIAGKGMMKPIKARFPDVNIIAVDYDSSATQINQENRLKLMLANAADARRQSSPAAKEAPEPQKEPESALSLR